MLSRIVLLCGVTAAALLPAGCGGSQPAADRTIVASFSPLAYAAEQVAGPHADVYDLTRAGAEPHDLELSPRDVARVHDARLVVYVGHGFQPAVDDALRGRDGPSLDVLSGIRLHGSGDDVDPHVWLDPKRYEQVAREIGAALGDRTRVTAFVRRLSALDATLARGLRHCERRTLVTSHASFGYFAERYGLRQVALVGLAPDTEPGPRAVGRLADEVRATGATTVFTEPLVSEKLAQTVAREAGAATAELDPLEVLSSSEETGGADYFTVMRRNLAVLRTALECR